MGTIITIVLIATVVLGGLYAINNPDDIFALFADKPNVKFFETPSLTESAVKVNHATNLSVSARNLDDVSFSNIETKLSVIKGGSWEEHLKFEPVTKLANDLSPGIVTDKILIPITATKLSGIETPFTLKAELFVDGVRTDSYTFNLKIQ